MQSEVSEFCLNEFKKIRELKGGLRSTSYLVEYNNMHYVMQIYNNKNQYQARKKYNLFKLINESSKNIPIPTVYLINEDINSSILVTSYIYGDTIEHLYERESNAIKMISTELAKILYDIHKINVGKYYGWITEAGVNKKTKIGDYLNDELERFKDYYKKELNTSQIKHVMNIGRKALNTINSFEISPSLVWYDLNRNNIIAKNEKDILKVNGILDPGGARYGYKEWDFAFMLKNFCKTKYEFECIINEYLSIGGSISEELLKSFIIFVELDDLAMQIADCTLYRPPSTSLFEDILINISGKFEKIY